MLLIFSAPSFGGIASFRSLREGYHPMWCRRIVAFLTTAEQPARRVTPRETRARLVCRGAGLPAWDVPDRAICRAEVDDDRTTVRVRRIGRQPSEPLSELHCLSQLTVHALHDSGL